MTGGTIHPIELPTLSADALAALDQLSRTIRDVQLQTRAQMIVLAAEQRLVAPQIAVVVRTAEATVRRWRKH